MLYETEEVTQRWKDTTLRLDTMKTFAVLPYSALDSNSGLPRALEQQLMFFMRNLIEIGGYRNVVHIDSADFVVVTNAINEDATRQLNPSRRLMDTVFPIPAYPLTQRDPATVALDMIGLRSYGRSSGYQSRLEEPMRHSSQVAVFIYNRKLGNCIYRAVGTAVSLNSDIAISSQKLIIDLVRNIPSRDSDLNLGTPAGGQIGASLVLMTLGDGGYLPVIWKLTNAAPKVLRVGDIILKIDGVTMQNRSIIDAYKLLRGEPGQIHQLLLKRLNEEVAVTVTMHLR